MNKSNYMLLARLLLAIFLLGYCELASAQSIERSDELLVQLHKGKAVGELMNTFQFNKGSNALRLEYLKAIVADFNIHLLRFDESKIHRNKALEAIRQHPLVAAAQLNDHAQMRAIIPNDPFFADQWNMRQIKMPEVWDVSTGGLTANQDTIVVAVMDAGCKITHEDLLPNIWFNHTEIPGDGVDNDGNGYIDDHAGLYIKDLTDEHPDHFHGCAVTGIVGARGDNGKGVSGVNWTVKMMLISGAEFPSEIVEAYAYVYDMRKKYNETAGQEGAFVVAANYSFGIDFGDCINDYPVWGSMYDSIGQVGVLGVTAAPNENINVDEAGDMPTSCTSEFMIAVTNSDINDDKVQAAGFGALSMDLAAPGTDITTTKRNNQYGDQGSGSSWSAPLVSGAIALLYSLPCGGLADNALEEPAATARLMKRVIIEGVDPSATLEGRTVSGGRLNVFNSLGLLQSEFGGQIGKLDVLNIFPNPPQNHEVFIEYQRPDFEDYQLQVFNSIGQLMFEDKISGNCAPRYHRINTYGWGAGIYFVSIENSDNQVSARFMIDK